MKTAIAAVTGTVLGLAFSAGVTLADHVEPAKAKKAQFELVNSFFQCDSPNTATSKGEPACTPVQGEGDGLCGLLPTGSGKLSLKTIGSAAQGTQDIQILAVATGLNAQCVGQMCVKLSFRVTTDDCPEGSCTIAGGEDVDTNACCIPANGKCKINTTLSAALPDFFTPGKNTGFEIRGCGLKDSFAFALPPEITCGVLLK